MDASKAASVDASTAAGTVVSGQWMPVTTSEQLAAADGGTLVVRLHGTPWIVTRLDGDVTALLDRCPHRRVPLSAGRVIGTNEGQRVECGYHGWQFDRTGTCTSVPALGSGASVPKGMRVAAAEAVVEAYGVIWLALRTPSTPRPELPVEIGPGAVLLPPRRIGRAVEHPAEASALDAAHQPGRITVHALQPETSGSTVVYTWLADA